MKQLRAHGTADRTRALGAIVALAALLVPSPLHALKCRTKTPEDKKVYIVALDKTLDMSAVGIQTANIQPDGAGGHVITWEEFGLSGFHPVTGKFRASHDRKRLSKGTIKRIGSTEFPVKAIFRMFEVLEMDEIGTLVSTKPIIFEGTFDAIPPRGKMKLVGPVDFHMQGDTSKKTVATLLEARLRLEEPPQ